MKTEGNRAMTQAEELRLLRQHIREDVAALHAKFDGTIAAMHSKMDSFISDNHQAHESLNEKLSKLDKSSGINATKIGLFVTLVAITVTAIATAGFNHILS